MKVIIVLAVTLMLSGCAGTWVHIEETGKQSGCAPTVNVESLGNSVTLSENTQCMANSQ